MLSQPSIKEVEEISSTRSRSKETNPQTTTLETNHYRSLTGSLLWHGTRRISYLLVLASSVARKTQEFLVKHLKQGNANLKCGKALDTTIRIRKVTR